MLRVAAESHKLALGDFLAKTDLIVHGTTVSTNALVEGKVAPAGLICNAGHPDILTLRESPRKRAFNTKIDFPPPYIPRNRTCEVRGRIDAMGNEIEKLNEQDVVAAAKYLKKAGVEAVAVCLLWSIVNPKHEQRVREILKRELPGVPVTLSHELNPIPREYRRTISTAINASLFPIVSAYTREAGERAEAERLQERAADRQLRRRHDAAGRDHPAADLQRHVRADAGADRRHAPDRPPRTSSSSTWAARPSTSRRCAAAAWW